MLKELQLTDFKSFADDAAPIPFAPVTILVGANGSGKSNLLDAIRFLQGIGTGLSIAEILAGKSLGGREIAPGLRGGAAEVCRAGTEAFTVRSVVELGVHLVVTKDSAGGLIEESPISRFEHAITCGPKPRPRVVSESLHVDRDRPLEITPEHLKGRFSRERSLLTEVTFPHKLAEGETRDAHEDGNGDLVSVDRRYFAGRLLSHYADTRFLNVEPSLMKGYVSLSVDELGEHGENLSAVVRHICTQPERKEQYLDWLGELCAPQVTDIDFDKTKSDKVQVRLKEGDPGNYVSAESISDGTLRFMAILAAMYSAPEGSLFLMEEIENGLHPTRVHLLVEFLEQMAKLRNIQIIATTHSSQVLLSLSREALRSAVLFARPEGSPGTVTQRLGDLPHFEEVTQRTEIDRLFAAGWLESVL
ncbi:MAG: AAA family ATPase [Planctomycetia bacterium]|nr:AAA family ATPase [Planctomycetia bacterium]